MPTATLRPGEVVRFFTPGGSQPNPVIVGSGAVWADDDDATYAQAFSPAAPADELPNASSPAAVIDMAGKVITSAVIHVRAKVETARPLEGYRYSVEFRNPPVGSSGLSSTIARIPLYNTGDGIEEQSFDVSGYIAGYPAVAINFFAIAGGFMVASWDATATIYEVWLDVTYTATGRAKPVRMYPANHPALGTARLYPPARSRAAGRLNGYQ